MIGFERAPGFDLLRGGDSIGALLLDQEASPADTFLARFEKEAAEEDPEHLWRLIKPHITENHNGQLVSTSKRPQAGAVRRCATRKGNDRQTHIKRALKLGQTLQPSKT